MSIQRQTNYTIFCTINPNFHHFLGHSFMAKYPSHSLLTADCRSTCPLKLLLTAAVMHTTDTLLLLTVFTLLSTTDQQSFGQSIAVHHR